jgi:hypothetical protein
LSFKFDVTDFVSSLLLAEVPLLSNCCFSVANFCSSFFPNSCFPSPVSFLASDVLLSDFLLSATSSFLLLSIFLLSAFCFSVPFAHLFFEEMVLFLLFLQYFDFETAVFLL